MSYDMRATSYIPMFHMRVRVSTLEDIITCVGIHLDTLKLVKLPNENYKDKLCHTVQNFSQHRYMFPHAEGHIRKLYHPIFTKVRSCSDVKSEKCDRWRCDYGVTCGQSLLDASPLFHILPQYKYALSIMLTPQNALLSFYSLSCVVQADPDWL